MFDFFGIYQSFFQGEVFNPFGIDSPAVIRDCKMDLAGFVEGFDFDPAFCRLFHFQPFFRRLDAMVTAITDDMDKRIGQGFKNGLVQLHIITMADKYDVLAQFDGKIPHNAWDLAEQLTQFLPTGLPIAALLEGDPILIAQDAHREKINALMSDAGVNCEYELAIDPSLYVRIMEDYVEVARSSAS